MGDRICLSDPFQRTLHFRDLLQSKIDFANLVTPDVAIHFNSLITDPHRFMRRARVFELFDYHRCFESTDENYRSTCRWMRFTTALTRYEARGCLHHHDFSRYRDYADIGGNSGEFALQICKRYPQIRATVVDLPLVCDIGRKHVSFAPESSRITFLKGDALAMELPAGYDVISFKSMLHDWPEKANRTFIRKAGGALRLGGTLLIFERGPIPSDGMAPSYVMIPILLFFRFSRVTSIYVSQLTAAGFGDIQVEHIQLDTPFFLISAKKNSPGFRLGANPADLETR